MDKYDVIIIGAGVAGLVAGLKLSCSDKKVLLLEKQAVPGGFATTFSRKGYTFESAIHCVDNLTADEEIRNFLDESGVSKEINFIKLNDFARIIYPEHDFIADFNKDNFVSTLKANFPQEAKNIDRLFREFKRFHKQLDKFSLSKLPDLIKLVLAPFSYPAIIKASVCTADQFIARFTRDTKLKAMISDIWRFAGLPPSRLSALYFLLIFNSYYYNSTAYVKGGFTQLFQAMLERMKEQKAEVRFNTAVTRILTAKGKSVQSVLTDRGEEFKAKVIISNANAVDTLTELLDDESAKELNRKKLQKLEKSVSACQIYLGLSVPAKDLGMTHSIFSINTTYDPDKNFQYSLSGDYQHCSLGLVDHAQVDPTLVPANKGSLLIMTLDSYENWKGLSEIEYRKKKTAVANQLILRAERYLPQLSGNIEVMEVASPRTISRFGSSPEGAIYGFAPTVSQSGMNRLSQETKIQGLLLAGAWTRPGGGVHACFISGEDAAELALKLL